MMLGKSCTHTQLHAHIWGWIPTVTCTTTLSPAFVNSVSVGLVSCRVLAWRAAVGGPCYGRPELRGAMGAMTTAVFAPCDRGFRRHTTSCMLRNAVAAVDVWTHGGA